MTIMLYIIAGILVLFITYIFATDRCKNKFEQELAACQKEYDRKIEGLKSDFKKLSSKHGILEKEYEQALNNINGRQEKYNEMFKQKLKSDNKVSKLQNELFCSRKARKDSKKHLGSNPN